MAKNTEVRVPRHQDKEYSLDEGMIFSKVSHSNEYWCEQPTTSEGTEGTTPNFGQHQVATLRYYTGEK